MQDSAARPEHEEVPVMAALAHHEVLLGRGIYDVAEISRLVRRSPDEISTWTERGPARRRHTGADAGDGRLLIPQDRRVFSFYDLISAAVVAELRRRSVPLETVRDARAWLQGELGVLWPLAHAVGLQQLASAGRSVYFLSDSGWLDAGQCGQMPFKTVVEPLLKHLQFDEASAMATSWRPADGVVLDPAVQAGAPCLEGTRLTTELIADLVEDGDGPEEVADDFDVDIALIEQGLAYERSLTA